MTTISALIASLTQGQHLARVTIPASWCEPDDLPATTAAAEMVARDAGCVVRLARRERNTIAVYVLEPACDDARGWDRYRSLRCTTAQRIA